MCPPPNIIIIDTWYNDNTAAVLTRFEPIMLKNLPIILFQTFQKIYPFIPLLFLYYSFKFTGSVK